MLIIYCKVPIITDFGAQVLPLRIIFRQFVESAKPDGLDSSRHNSRQSQQDFRFPLSLWKCTYCYGIAWSYRLAWPVKQYFLWNYCSTSLRMTLFNLLPLHFKPIFRRRVFDATTPPWWHILSNKQRRRRFVGPTRLHRCFLSSSIFGAKRPISQAKWFLFKNIDQLSTWGFTFGLFVLTQLGSFFFSIRMLKIQGIRQTIYEIELTHLRDLKTPPRRQKSPGAWKSGYTEIVCALFLFFWVVLHYTNNNWIVVYFYSCCIVLQDTYCIVLCCIFCSIVLFLRDPPHHALKSQSGPDQPLISDAVCVLQSLRWFWISEKPSYQISEPTQPSCCWKWFGKPVNKHCSAFGQQVQHRGNWAMEQKPVFFFIFKKLPQAIHCIKHLGTNCSNWAITSHSTPVQDVG